MTEIAIVGLSCRFPGALNLNQLWNVLIGAIPQTGPIPRHRWNHDTFFGSDSSGTVPTSYSDKVCFLEEIDEFSPRYFGIPPKRANAMDPQHRLLVELGREAIQDAGWERASEFREYTGVFAGMSSTDFRDVVASRCSAVMLADGSLHDNPDPQLLGAISAAAEDALDRPQAYSLPGCLLNMGPAAVSHVFNLRGPSVVVDSACASSLVALDLAVRSIRTGSCRAALVGGVFLNLTPMALIGFSKVGALSRRGECRPFDARADGFVLGEGGALVLIRPLEDAIAAGDRVYAVIRGVGITNDGGGAGIMTPSIEGQINAIEAAYGEAGFRPEIDFLEAHGTGTFVGDHVEADALQRVRDKHQVTQRCYISSSKAIFGHSLAAAGAIGLVKTALALHHRVAPPLSSDLVEADLPLSATGVVPVTEPQALDSGSERPVRGAVSSFGFGGTNVHVVMEAAGQRRDQSDSGEPWLVVLSAGDLGLLASYARAVADQAEASAASVASVARTLASRVLLEARLALVVSDRTQLVTRLRQAAARLAAGEVGNLGDGVIAGEFTHKHPLPRVGFLYPGQGMQRPGMLRHLVGRFGVARGVARPWIESLARLLNVDVAGLLCTMAHSHARAMEILTRTEICQPALGLVAAVTTDLLSLCGVRPDVVLGHSVGEFSAAAAAGVMDTPTALRFLALRGAAMSVTGTPGEGTMLAIRADRATFERLSSGIDGVWLGCHNGQESIVASGRIEGIARLAERCTSAGAAFRQLTVSHAFHSPLVAKADQDVAATLADLPLRQPSCTLISTVSGTSCDRTDELRRLWSRQNSSPVLFHEAVATLRELDVDFLVQVSGAATLVSEAAVSRPDHPVTVVKLSGDDPDEGEAFLRGLGALAVAGVDVDLRSLFNGSNISQITLPPSPLKTQRCSVLKENASRTRFLSDEPPVPAPSESVASGISSGVGSETEGNDQVSEIVELFREQIALLSSLDSRTLRSAGSEPSATRGNRIERHIPPASAIQESGTYTALSTPANATRLVQQELNAVLPVATRSDDTSPGNGNRGDLVFDKLLDGISRVTAFPRDAISKDSSLRQELGLDSLMLAELLSKLRQEWPSLTVLPEDFLDVATVGDAARMLSGKLGIAPAAETTPGLEEQCEVDAFEEIVALNRRYEMLSTLGVRNPYFLTHERTIRDTTLIEGRELISFSSYNYLGLSGHPVVLAAAKQALDQYGSSVSAARLLSGQRPLHVELDRQIAELLGTEAAVTLVSGHGTNMGLIGHLFGGEDLVVHDSLAHDSILQGCKLSRAARQPFAHNDVRALDALLSRVRRNYRRVLIVVEGIYSMDGDIAPLPELIEIKRRHHALLMVDEAHSIGVLGATGRGIGEHHGVDSGDVDIWMGTLSKSFASCGGYLAGRRNLIDYLCYTLPGYIYSAGMTPPNTAAASAAIRLMLAEPERVTRLRERSQFFLKLTKEAGFDVSASKGTPIIPCIIGDSLRTVNTSTALFDHGISVNPILHPAVEERATRLRFFVTSEHSEEQLTRTVEVLRAVLQSSPVSTIASHK